MTEAHPPVSDEQPFEDFVQIVQAKIDLEQQRNPHIRDVITARLWKTMSYTERNALRAEADALHLYDADERARKFRSKLLGDFIREEALSLQRSKERHRRLGSTALPPHPADPDDLGQH